MRSWAIFTPIYLGVVVPDRWFVRHRDHPQAAAFIADATAAAAGAIAGATLLTRQVVTDWPSVAIALTALVVLWRFKLPEGLALNLRCLCIRGQCSATGPGSPC